MIWYAVYQSEAPLSEDLGNRGDFSEGEFQHIIVRSCSSPNVAFIIDPEWTYLEGSQHNFVGTVLALPIEHINLAFQFVPCSTLAERQAVSEWLANVCEFQLQIELWDVPRSGGVLGQIKVLVFRQVEDPQDIFIAIENKDGVFEIFGVFSEQSFAGRFTLAAGVEADNCLIVVALPLTLNGACLADQTDTMLEDIIKKVIVALSNTLVVISW